MSEKNLSSPFLSDLREGETFEGFYVVKESSLQTAVNGKQYVRLTIGDATASLGGNIWDANSDLFLICAAGTVIKLQGTVESYKGKLQVKITRVRPAHESEIDLDRFLPVSVRSPDEMRKELLDVVASLKDHDYKRLAEAFFHDEPFLERFSRWPAAREVHHAWLGGLIEHSLNLARQAEHFAKSAPINRDLLLLGTLLHDVGKTRELSVKLTFDYSDEGKLLGHLVIGTIMVKERAANLDAFPVSKLWLVQHLILSHHGRYEYGSPVLPKTPEAFALHYLDNLDAKVETAVRLITSHADDQKNWTERSWLLETDLYKGLPALENPDA